MACHRFHDQRRLLRPHAQDDAGHAPVPAPAVAPESIPDAEAEAHFRKDPSVYQLPERRKAKYLLVESAQLRAEAAKKVTEADVSAEYSKNLDSYRKAEEVTARHVLYKSDGTRPRTRRPGRRPSRP